MTSLDLTAAREKAARGMYDRKLARFRAGGFGERTPDAFDDLPGPDQLRHLDEAEAVIADALPLIAAEVASVIVDTVLALHRNNDGPNDWCIECAYGPNEAWPCPTVRALAPYLAAETQVSERGSGE